MDRRRGLNMKELDRILKELDEKEETQDLAYRIREFYYSNIHGNNPKKESRIETGFLARFFNFMLG
jgi:hypothetical protein